MDKLKQSANALLVSFNKETVLALDTELTPIETKASGLFDIKKSSGWILKKSGLEEFHFTETGIVDGNVVLFSPGFNPGVKALFSCESELDTITDLIHMASFLEEEGIKIPRYSANLFYRTDKDEILMMPPELIRFINNRKTLEDYDNVVTRFNHPDAQGQEAFLYSAGILLYCFATCRYAFDYCNTADLRDKMRRRRILKPQWADPLLKESVCDLIYSLLYSEKNPGLQVCYEQLEEIKREGIHSQKKPSPVSLKVTFLREKTHILSDKIRYFTVKNHTPVSISAILLVILSSFAISCLKLKDQKPLTAGFSAAEVVESYFLSFKDKNPALLDDVLAQGVRSTDENELAILHVIKRFNKKNSYFASTTREMREDKVYIENEAVHPEVWLTLDEEERSQTKTYGMTDIKIRYHSPNRYKVEYEKWYSRWKTLVPENKKVLSVTKLLRDEIFVLKKTEHSYEIIDIITVHENSETVWESSEEREARL